MGKTVANITVRSDDDELAVLFANGQSNHKLSVRLPNEVGKLRNTELSSLPKESSVTTFVVSIELAKAN